MSTQNVTGQCLRPACTQLETHQSIKANCTHLKRTHTHQERKRHHLHPLEEETGRRQYKNTSNNRKTNMTPPESRDSTPARPEHPNTDEAEESKLKNNFMQMIETLREEVRKSFREMEEKTNQKMQEIKESQENTIKQLKETVQDMKIEIDTIKKTQTEGLLEVEKLSKQSGTTDASITNGIQEMEDRISDTEDKLEEINSSSKENLKSNKSFTQNIQEI
ncbi:GTPase IMAP family member 3-like protein [Cricetulus griseus]|nr:GTPase IMAP family member 3-like protein [Cricetulus griseus]